MQVKTVTARYVEMEMEAIRIYTFPMKVKDLVKISYVAVRGRDKEGWQNCWFWSCCYDH